MSLGDVHIMTFYGSLENFILAHSKKIITAAHLKLRSA